MSSYGMWLSAAGMQASEYRQAVLANNLANAQTTGFKQDLALVQQRRVETRENPTTPALVHPVFDGMSGGMAAMPTFHSFEQGAVERTGSALDLAIDGEGFFTVSDGTATRYTRDGGLTINRAGELVMAAGGGRWRLRDSAGAAIATQPGGGAIKVSGDGTVRQGANVIGQIELVQPADERALRKAGENLFELRPEAAVTRGGGRIVAEAREQSNFDTMKGLAGMIEASRAYQLNATMVQLQDQSTGLAVSRVGRVA